MIKKRIKIIPSDKLEIISVIDNHLDLFLENQKYVYRPPIFSDKDIADTFISEHGLSILIKVYKGSKIHTILLDAGYSDIGVPYNIKLLNIDPLTIDDFVLSHGHMDHYGSLSTILKNTNPNTNVILHPDVFFLRGFKSLENKYCKFQPLNKNELVNLKAKLTITKDPHIFSSNLALTTGEIPRCTSFEKASLTTWRMNNNQIEVDPILDDQGLVFNIKDKGLVIISGCAHAGIINTIYHAKKLTQIDKVFAIIGGFHLCGNLPEKTIDNTIEKFIEINPEIIVPMHCTGWKATNKIANALPDKFVLNTVGTKYIF
ncbi:MAG: MBL fold metallo-hydrolase [Parachlamydiales bacterium]|nr:MBL fold metallo-hydrolase [Parachlamydiales bacterium]